MIPMFLTPLKYVTNEENFSNEGPYEHGDDYISAEAMQRRHRGARQGKRTNGEGIEEIVWTRKGEWIFESISERIRSNHRLYNEIQEPTALR